MKKRKNIPFKNKREKYEFNSELFISNRNNIEENVLKLIKKDNISSKKD